MAEKYQAPALPDDVLPDLQPRIDHAKAKWQEHKAEGYAIYSRARAQQMAAEDCERRGQKDDAKALMEGVRGQNGGMIGVKDLDTLAQIQWSEARKYKAELDRLEAEKAAQKAEEPEGDQ